jgi:hypothetical protein
VGISIPRSLADLAILAAPAILVETQAHFRETVVIATYALGGLLGAGLVHLGAACRRSSGPPLPAVPQPFR